jgi:hypothetical protein
VNPTTTPYTPGQPVIVRATRSGVPQPEFDGVFLGYWRNGLYWVRENEHGTQCVYKLAEIHAAEKELPCPAAS